MRTWLTALTIATSTLALTACPAGDDTSDTSTTSTTSSSTTGTSATETGSGGETETETGGESGVEVIGPGLEHLGEEQMPPQLSAMANDGGVDVEHIDHWDNCCYMPAVTAEVEGQVVNVTYMHLGDDCDCVCSWGLTYRLEGLEPGSWTIQVGELSAEVEL